MTLPALALLSAIASAQLIEVNIPDGGAVGRDAADAIQFGLSNLANALPATVAAARGEGPLVTTQLDAREAVHVESGAVAFTITVPPEAVKVESGAVVIEIRIPVDDAVAVALPWLQDIALPALREEAQMIRDDVRTSVGRDSAELVSEIRKWMPWCFALAAIVSAAIVFERVTNNRRS